jgi:ABC-2 type transport system permease protein
MVALGFGFGPIYQQAGGGDYIAFLAPGVIAMSILFSAIFTGIEVIWDKKFGFLKETLVSPVPRYKIMLGRTLGGATVAVIQGVIVFFITMLFGFRPESWAFFPLALVFMFIIALLFTALGTAIASILEDMQGFQLIMNFLVMPVFFLSGSLFPLENLPKSVFIVSQIDPLSYGVDGLRASLINISHFGIALDLGILIIVTFIIMLIGTYLFSKIEA